MSNTLGIDFAADTREQATDLGTTITIGSTAGIVAVVGPESRDFNAEDDPRDRVRVYARAAQAAVADLPGAVVPAYLTTVTTGGRAYAMVDAAVEATGETVDMRLERREPMQNDAD